MSDRPARRKAQLHQARVRRTEWLTPHMIRVVLGGEGLSAFTAGAFTDHYVKLLFPVEGVAYPRPLDMELIRAEFPRDQWPRTRTYTVRRWDADEGELTVDFVHHGDTGLAGPWAARARPGDEIAFLGPGGAYTPDPAADWHLLAGDEAALPAIAAALERIPDDARTHAFIEVAGPAEEQKLEAPDAAEITWVHRTGPVGHALVHAVSALSFPPGTPHAFVHGEAGCVKQLRHLLRVERQVPRERLSISGYWRVGHDEDGWQASKREWNQRVEEEQEGTAAS
ncbi:siderophore-interacting protein [Goodfellowiella coeruleoviolacea]|uniref:NADPH-dependent ferric siderophore reductase, contains FAD-binding and SIP domains n=1 Tax=Goodfellowiella coeruleoviolacea TaxID=334858 RepID=A0AAE3KH02_9PSEU|nr:siderophore-interacting protein [Goodfellowiella coeruleoviolacea]MCP2167811.1 NADPH-dependent ferric siderophore reductase, contains FAD-binding and SIP domains [Goodfellowiella coeruleoviolacea]